MEVLLELGSGVQGRVVLARVDGVVCAVKYLAPALLADERHLARFRTEAELLRAVDDPHVARFYAYWESEGEAAIVQEAIEGAPLREILARHAPLEPEQALTVLKGSLLGLAAAHAAGVVHRDYKPSNVIVRPDGLSKLVDFGVAGLAGDRRRSGTPAYMAPEQWWGEPDSPATDVYAATCVFYEAITGAPPYAGDLEHLHTEAPIPVENVPEPLKALVETGMAKSPEGRPADAAAFAAELETAATAAYGPDWERRGLAGLLGLAAALAAFSLFGDGTLAQAATSLADSKVGRWLTPNKIIIGSAALVTALALGTASLVLDSSAATSPRVRAEPTPPPGGTASGVHTVSLDVSRTVPFYPAGSMSKFTLRTVITPAVAYPDAVVKARVNVEHVTPFGTRKSGCATYRGQQSINIRLVNEDFKVMALYPSGGTLPPAGGGIKVPRLSLHKSESNAPFTPLGPCSGIFRFKPLIYTFVIPSTAPSGRYGVSVFSPPGLVEISYSKDGRAPRTVKGVSTKVEGELPVLTVLPG